MKTYPTLEKAKTFQQKALPIKKLIHKALYILEVFGLPLKQTPRRLERMALVFLACADIKTESELNKPKDLDSGFMLKTRDIIQFVNENFQENISRGSYDDIRRKDLKLLVIAGVILPSSPSSATNDSTRAYGLNPAYTPFLNDFGVEGWEVRVKKALGNTLLLTEHLERNKSIPKVKVLLPGGSKLEFSPGEHNELQKAIIEEFLPRYGYGAKLLYVGDTIDKYLYLDKKQLKALNFFDIAHEELPDIIAYSADKKWLYLIEAVHSSGPISEIRLLELQKLTQKCNVPMVYVTAFLNRKTFRKFMAEIAWETEVWIAESPDHLVHFNGDKFLGPYTS